MKILPENHTSCNASIGKTANFSYSVVRVENLFVFRRCREEFLCNERVGNILNFPNPTVQRSYPEFCPVPDQDFGDTEVLRCGHQKRYM